MDDRAKKSPSILVSFFDILLNSQCVTGQIELKGHQSSESINTYKSKCIRTLTIEIRCDYLKEDKIWLR